MTDRFSLLPEWAEQEAVLMAWPHESTDWQPWLAAIQRDYAELAVAISREVTPLILCQDEAHRELILSQLDGRCEKAPELVIAPYNDTWCRDYGAITLGPATGTLGGSQDANSRRLLDFCFNGWGDKYDADLDNGINRSIASIWQPELQTIDFELEGGSIETDGAGTLLTTTHCLLDSNRNNDFSKEQIEAFVLEKLGLQRCLWLSRGALFGDDTDSHIDNLARFSSADTIVYAICSDVNDPHHEHLKAMEAELQQFRRPDGQPYVLKAIEIPAPQFDEDGKRLPGSYINFLIVNGSVIVPVFDCPQDAT
ncbi:MAG TPA: agmatine deiminase family protein, partial [Dongiaceae bacterium]|nr:agmatine deiminase family protein [Dongiaceae bacterium]